MPRQSLVGGSLSTRGEDKSDGVVKVKACCRFEFDIGIFIYAAEYMGNKFTGKASMLLANCLTNTLRDECELEEKTEIVKEFIEGKKENRVAFIPFEISNWASLLMICES